MADDEHLDRVREQFTRTAEVYARLMQATQERGLSGLVGLSGAGPSDRVLDVCCGPGFLTMAFAKRCGEAIGFDATEAFLELARAEAARRGLTNLRFESGDAQQLPFANASFQVVSCRAAFHHLADPGRVLAEMARVAAPNGRIVVADLLGSEDPEKAQLHDRIERLCDPTHVRAIPVSEFERLFAAAGLRLVAKPCTVLDYDLEEWMSHGAPDEAARSEIVALVESSLDRDRAGLRTRREGGRLCFSHQGAAFVLQQV